MGFMLLDICATASLNAPQFGQDVGQQRVDD
jgi:hypothetical protein